MHQSNQNVAWMPNHNRECEQNSETWHEAKMHNTHIKTRNIKLSQLSELVLSNFKTLNHVSWLKVGNSVCVHTSKNRCTVYFIICKNLYAVTNPA